MPKKIRPHKRNGKIVMHGSVSNAVARNNAGNIGQPTLANNAGVIRVRVRRRT